MKIRNGFVSNSSSSSFLVLGIEVNLKEIGKLIKPEFADIIEEEDWYALGEKTGVWIESDDEGSDYIGVQFNFDDDTKTIGQLKQEAIETLTTVMVEPPKAVDLHYGSSYG